MSKGKTAKGTAIKQIEMRRCVACRQVRHKSELLRIVKTSDKISIDTGKQSTAPANSIDAGKQSTAPANSIDAGEQSTAPANSIDAGEQSTAPEISIDTTGKLDGRGAYVCKSLECAESLKKRRNLDRVFRAKVPTELYDTIKEIVLM